MNLLLVPLVVAHFLAVIRIIGILLNHVIVASAAPFYGPRIRSLLLVLIMVH